MQIKDVPQAWQPVPVDDEEVLDPGIGSAVAGLWDQPPPGDELPPLWHWFHFLGWTAQSRVGPDGHLLDGAFLPPLDDRRRMFAGGTWRHHAPLLYGQHVQRRRTVQRVSVKSGRTGELLFVTVRTELSQGGKLCQVENQDIVYRSGRSSVDLRDTTLATTAPLPAGRTSLPMTTDETLLFRMSALTSNQHRIHYDRSYAIDIEHYADLVVHGPMLVLHLAEILRRDPAAPVPSELSFRLHAPAYVGEPLLAVAEVADDGSTTLTMVSDRQDAHASARAVC